MNGRVVLVHNGIVENFKTLREELAAEGVEFRSETDTEVIVQLVERYMAGGMHRREGIFIAAGPGIKTGVELPEENIVDLAPTILHLLGEPVPRVMDGRVLTEALVDPAPVQFSEDGESEIATEHSFASDEAQQIEERLRGLGYL